MKYSNDYCFDMISVVTCSGDEIFLGFLHGLYKKSTEIFDMRECNAITGIFYLLLCVLCYKAIAYVVIVLNAKYHVAVLLYEMPKKV